MTEHDLSASIKHAAKLVARAESCAEQHDWQSADALFRQALSLDSTPYSQIAYGICLSRQERYFEAISIFTPILDGQDWSAIGIVCHNLAVIYREIGEVDLAGRFQWRATLMQDDSGVEDLLGLANDALSGQHHEVAESLIMAAHDLVEAEGDGVQDGDLIAAAALVKAASRATKDGLVALFTAYRCHRVTNDLRGMGADLVNMSVLFGDLDRHRAERSCLLAAIRCFEQAPAPFSLRRTRQQLNRLCQMQVVRSFDQRRN